MIAHVDWLFTEASPKLRYVCDGHVVERPKGIFIERRMSLFQTYFNAIGQESYCLKRFLSWTRSYSARSSPSETIIQKKSPRPGSFSQFIACVIASKCYSLRSWQFPS